MKKILFLFLFLLVINSCKKDEADVVSPGNEYTPKVITETYGTAKLVGFVNDKSGNPISGVTVFFGEEKTLTGSDGGYQLNSLSAGSNKRIWFQKPGYASTQKLADIREDLPNRIDASLFPIDKTGKMNSDGGKIEGKDFSVEIKPGGFVYSDGSPVEEDVIAEVTAFLTNEDEFLDAFPGEFRGTRENGTETAIESFGFIDVVLKVKSGEPVQLADGVTAIIKIKAPQNSPATIPLWHYDEDKAKWIEEGVGKLDNGFYTAEVSHFTKWNWDRPYSETSKIVGRVIDNAGSPIEGARVVQKGITYKFQNSAKTNEEGEFELLTPESNESEIEAQFDIYGSTIINYTTSSNQGQVNNIGDITIDVSIENVMPPFVSSNVLYITIGQTAKIRGKYFGEQKRAGYKLLLNGNEVETTAWQNELIEFNVPNGIPEEGTIQINRDGMLSKEVNYKEGDWTCEIDGKVYDNNDLPYSGGIYYLSLSDRSFNTIPNCFGNLRNLEWLNISNTQLATLPDSFGNLQNLNTANLGVNQLITLPENIGNLKKLKLLNISFNRLTIIPESIGNLMNLESLYVENNQLTTLPESISKLNNLEILKSDNNQLTTFPESISSLYRLREIDLSFNKINSLPKSIGNLQNLQRLSLNGNQLTTLPESIGNPQNLQVLSLNKNQLTALPESISNLVKLESLYVEKNHLTSFPENIGDLLNLQQLFLNENQLSSLPESITSLQNLKALFLSENQLTSLPENIGDLRNLESLILANNQLTTIPESIGNLKDPFWIELRNNQLTSLPESFKNLKETLNILSLQGNNFSEEEKAKVEEWLPNTSIGW